MQSITVLEFARNVEQFYAGLMAVAATGGGELGLGGLLLYAGELDAEGRALVVAGNIAGAAALTASADPAAQKLAIRDGVVDFLVTSLDEALRILKNEIRKRETVAVCVGLAPEAVEREMYERGVEPDLIGPVTSFDVEKFGNRPKRVKPLCIDAGAVLLTWSVSEAPARWMRELDVIATECLGAEDGSARRWLRLAPRFMGRTAIGMRVLRCATEVAQEFSTRVKSQVAQGEIGVAVAICVEEAGKIRHLEFAPEGM
jgi:urocanate hydratase